MPIVDVRDITVLEENTSYFTATFTLFLDQVATAPAKVSYFLQDGTASQTQGDYLGNTGTATIDTGSTSTTVTARIYGDTFIEGNEEFELVIIAQSNVELPDNAAALVATATIMDNDDAVPDGPVGTGDLAQRLYGPEAEAGFLPTVSVRSTSAIEGNSSYDETYFLFSLDRVATAPVTVNYFLQDGSASATYYDYLDAAGSVTIAAGQQSTWLSTRIYGDTFQEGNETLDLVAWNANNAVLAGGAAAIKATATILGDDSGQTGLDAGIGEFGVAIETPESASALLPTLDVRNASVVEGNSSYEEIHFLIMLDKPATAAVSGYYFLQDGSASDANGDFLDTSGQFTLDAGQQTGYLSIRVYGDTVIEPDETFELVLTSLQNAVFAGGAPSLTATGTIIGDDSGPVSQAGGEGEFSAQSLPAPSASGILPTVRVHDAMVIEGNSSYEEARFLVTLDKPAPSDVTMWYRTSDGSASNAVYDYLDTQGSFTILAGQSSGWVTVRIYGDTLLEGDETFSLSFVDVTNAVFEGGAPILNATATIIDNDVGPLSMSGGTGAPAKQVATPNGNGNVVEIVSASTAEGNSSYEEVIVFIALSQPASTNMSMSYETIEGSATEDVDYLGSSGTFNIAAGVESSYLTIRIYGDQNIEGDETFSVRFSNLSGGTFSNGSTTMDANIIIRDNEAGTAGDPTTGPEFTYAIAGITTGSDTISGTVGDDNVALLDGDDTFDGYDGNDTIDGGTGADTMRGGKGNDTYIVDDAGDVVVEHAGHGDDQVFSSLDSYTLTSGVEVGFITTVGTIAGGNQKLLAGDDDRDFLFGNSGDDILQGFGGFDVMQGFNGDDVYSVDNSFDAVIEAAGGGYDNVYSSADYIIDASQEIESAILTGNATVLRGSDSNNQLFGNDKVNVIEGKGGTDYLLGFGGDDIFQISKEALATDLDVIGDFEGAGVVGGDRLAFAASQWGLDGIVTQVSQTSFEVSRADGSNAQQFIIANLTAPVTNLIAGDDYFFG